MKTQTDKYGKSAAELAVMQEQQWDKLLKIRTAGRDDSRSDQYCYPYEPTPYRVLERLAGSGYIGKRQTLLDYGCGKGRVDFYMSYQTGCKTIGVEYDDRLYQVALMNSQKAISGRKTTFVLYNAQDYSVPKTVDRCFFFNPFSIEIFQKALAKIMASYYEHPREILLFFYYPSDEYIGFLMTQEQLMFTDEIDCRDLFDGDDPREKVLIFELL